MKNIYLFLTITLFCLSIVPALEITPEYNTNVVVRDLDNSIDLTLKIKNASHGTYNLYTLSDISIKPSEAFEITTIPFTKEFTLTPNENLDVEGYYSFTYTLNHRDVEKVDQKVLIKLMNLEDVIEISSDSIDPASGQISFYVRNKESVKLENLNAKFSSILFETTKTFTLEPNEKLVIPVEVEESKLRKTKAGVYVIESIFQTKDGTKKIEGNLYLGEKKGITSTQDESGILIKTQTITKINVGNVVESIEIKLQRNIFSRLFTGFNIEPTFTERKGLTIEHTWIKEKLMPTETYTVKAKTNYVLPFFIIIVAVLAILGYKRFSETKIEIKKSVSPVKTKNDEFALRITLALKAKRNVENVTLIDRVPAIVKIYNKFGTIKPDKINAESRRIHWNLGDLNAGEERILSYIVYSKVGVVGKFSLPKALVVFEKNEKIHEIDSNNVFFMNEQIRGN
jgi:hypothetical protein